MKKIIAVDAPHRRKLFPQAPHYSMAILDGDHIAILRPYEDDVVILNLKTHKSQVFAFRRPRANPDSLHLETHCLSKYGDDAVALYDPIDQHIHIWSIDGRLIRSIQLNFPVGALICPDPQTILVYGTYDGYLLHRINLNGQVLQSEIPVPENFEKIRFTLSSDKKFHIAGKKLYILLDAALGVVDLRNAESFELINRFSVRTRRVPVHQMFSGLAMNPNTKAHEPYLVLSFPRLTPTTLHSIAGLADEGIAAIGHEGKQLLLMDSTFKARRFFGLSEIGVRPTKFHQQPNIFAIERIGESWLACSFFDGIWLLEKEDLREISAAEFAAEPPLTQAGHPLSPYGTPPLIEPSFLRKQDQFWNSLKSLSCNFRIRIDASGRVISAELDNTYKNERQAEAHEIQKLLEIFRTATFSRRIIDGASTVSDVAIQVTIDPFSIALLEPTGIDLVTL